ncbi:hypothetical protein GCM10022239_03680 [Leifsonia bigeumensis]|uniref:C2H2-type domain-containing protein n=1 Tax=Leifsonella bigeumensis TaxID=433643 RepID=A0ABP7F3J5_9MICO
MNGTITVGESQTYSASLVVIECGSTGCGVVFALSDNYVAARRRDHKTWYCPNGHAQHYPSESDIERAERRRKEALRHANDGWAAWSASQDQLRASERSKAALKGHLTRARNKVAAGNCPAPGCGQHFANVREHMKFKHPEFHLTDPETGKAADL